jgi:drug/metabolite transporter (DMT)-like permease
VTVEPQRKGAWYALSAALLFGASTPFPKVLLGKLQPILLAGLLYLGSGLGLLLLSLLLRPANHKRANEARLSRADLPWLAGAIFSG